MDEVLDGLRSKVGDEERDKVSTTSRSSRKIF